MATWVIYVPAKSHSKINFDIGLSSSIWGVHDSKKDSIVKVKRGDSVVFVHAISWLGELGEMPKGFSRVPDYHDFKGIVKQIVIGSVTEPYYQSQAQVWPDDIYPHRFEFKIDEKFDDGVYFGCEYFNDDFVEAVRGSACNQGSVKLLPNSQGFQSLMKPELDELNDNSKIENEASGHEGKTFMRVHKYRERDPKIVKAKKNQVLEETGKLACEVCSLDFNVEYGERGYGFAECHHNKFLSNRTENEKTKLKELSILCANCHRMIHVRKPWWTVSRLKDIYEKQRAERASK